MGSACCVASRDRTIINGVASRDRTIINGVASRDRTIVNGTSSDVLQRNIRYSPSWSFRWDNRGRVAGEDSAVNWSSDEVSRHDRMEIKSRSTVEATYASEDGSPLNSSQTLTWQKSPISETNTEMLPLADQSTSTISPTEEVKDSVQSPAISDPSPTKLSPSMNSISSLSTSPLSSRGHLFPGGSTPSRWARRSPGHQLLRQVSDSRIPSHKSSNFSISEESSFLLPGWSNYSNRGSNSESSDRERWSCDSDPFGFNQEKIARSSSRLSSSPQINAQTCGVCSKLLTERSSWGSQKMVATEVPVVGVLICGHVYHAECLENMTTEVNKYDPVCPVCTFGEKKTLKLSEKALKVEIGLRTKNKRSRKRIISSVQDDDLSVFGDIKNNSRYEEKGIKMVSSGKPFLKRHFSFGSKGTTRSLLEENHANAARRKGFFWSKSTKQ